MTRGHVSDVDCDPYILRTVSRPCLLVLRLPPHVLPVPGNVPAPHPHHDPVQQQRLNLCVIGVLNHRDPAAEDRHAVALHKGSVPLASDVVLRPLPDQIVQPRRVEARSLPAEGNLPSAAKDKDVSPVFSEGLQADLHFLRVGRDQVGRQEQRLGIGELRTPSKWLRVTANT